MDYELYMVALSQEHILWSYTCDKITFANVDLIIVDKWIMKYLATNVDIISHEMFLSICKRWMGWYSMET
jgi:hypothetical protein